MLTQKVLNGLCVSLVAGLSLTLDASAAILAPTDLIVTPTNSRYAIAWTKPSGTISQILTLSNGAQSYQVRTTFSTITIPLSTPGTWTIAVQGRTSTEIGPQATTTVNVTAAAPSTTPTGVSIAPQSSLVDLRWTASSTTDTMKISWTDPVTNTEKQILTRSTSATIPGLQNGTLYTFTLAWVNLNGTGPSTTVTATPSADRLNISLSTPTAISLGGSSTQLTWAPVPGATFYAIYAGPSSDFATLKSTVRPRVTSNTSFTVTGVQSGWSAFIIPGNRNGLSLTVPVATGLPIIAPPSDKPVLTIIPGAASATASWTTVSGATTYQLNYNIGAYNAATATSIQSSTSPLVLTNLAALMQHTAVVMGQNAGGNGPGSDPQTFVPLEAQPFRLMKYLAAGERHSLTVRPAGQVVSAGENAHGQLGDWTTTQRLTPVSVLTATDIVSVSAGQYFSVALQRDGTVWTWGANNASQLGDGLTADRPVPYHIPGLTNVIDIAAGANHVIVLKADGTVWGWGANESHQVSNASATVVTTPTQVQDLISVRQVAAGVVNSYALLEDGTVWSWGANTHGELGNGTTNASTTPVTVSIVSNVALLRAGGGTGYAVKKDGTVWAWGRNDMGSIGNGTLVDAPTPVQVPGVSSIMDIGTGYGHAYALTSDGQLYTWGLNGNRQLGHALGNPYVNPYGLTTVRSTVTLAQGPTALHSMRMNMDWSLVLWGSGSSGQLGNGVTTASVADQNVNMSSLWGGTEPVVITPVDVVIAAAPPSSWWAWAVHAISPSSSFATGSTIQGSKVSFPPIPGRQHYDLEYWPFDEPTRRGHLPIVNGSVIPADRSTHGFMISDVKTAADSALTYVEGWLRSLDNTFTLATDVAYAYYFLQDRTPSSSVFAYVPTSDRMARFNQPNLGWVASDGPSFLQGQVVAYKRGTVAWADTCATIRMPYAYGIETNFVMDPRYYYYLGTADVVNGVVYKRWCAESPLLPFYY